MELRLVKNELQKCHQYEGVNHYSVCEPLANKYVDMLKDHKVSSSYLELTYILIIISINQVKGYKIQDKDI